MFQVTFPQNKPKLVEIDDGPMGASYMRVNEFIVPLYTFEGIKRYVEQRLPPGDFLHAVLTNDLKEAVAHGDLNNLSHLVDIVKVLYNYAPAICWGDDKRVQRWLAKQEEP